MVLPLDLVQRIAQHGKKVVVGTEYLAVQTEFDHRLRLADRLELAFEIGRLHSRLGDVGGDLHDLDHTAHFIANGGIDRLNPDLLPGFGDALEHVTLRLAGVQVAPELLVGGRSRIHGVDKHAVMLAPDLVDLVAHQLQEILVGFNDIAGQVEFGESIGRIDRAQDALGVLTFDFSHRDVVAHAQVLHRLAVVAQNRCDHRVHIVGRAVLGPVLDDAAEHVAAADRGPELLESLLGHVGVARGVVRLADQLVAPVLGHLNELVVDADDVALAVGFRHDAGDVHDVGTHLQLGLELGHAALEGGKRGFGLGAGSFLLLGFVVGLLQFRAAEKARDPGGIGLVHDACPCDDGLAAGRLSPDCHEAWEEWGAGCSEGCSAS